MDGSVHWTPVVPICEANPKKAAAKSESHPEGWRKLCAAGTMKHVPWTMPLATYYIPSGRCFVFRTRLGRSLTYGLEILGHKTRAEGRGRIRARFLNFCF